MNKQDLILKITEWAKQLNFKVNVMEEPTVDLLIIVTQEGLPPVHIIRPRENPILLFITKVALSEEQQKKISNLDKTVRDKIFWEIKLGLLQMNVDFNSLPNQPFPVAFDISRVLFINGATFQDFLDKYNQIKAGALYVAWSIQKIIPPQEDTSLPAIQAEIPQVSSSTDTEKNT